MFYQGVWGFTHNATQYGGCGSAAARPKPRRKIFGRMMTPVIHWSSTVDQPRDLAKESVIEKDIVWIALGIEPNKAITNIHMNYPEQSSPARGYHVIHAGFSAEDSFTSGKSGVIIQRNLLPPPPNHVVAFSSWQKSIQLWRNVSPLRQALKFSSFPHSMSEYIHWPSRHIRR